MTDFDLSAIPFDPWWAVPQNLADLWLYLCETGRAPLSAATFLRDPDVYEDEWVQMSRERVAGQL